MRRGHVTATWFALYYDKTFAQEDMELLGVGYKTMTMSVG